MSKFLMDERLKNYLPGLTMIFLIMSTFISFLAIVGVSQIEERGDVGIEPLVMDFLWVLMNVYPVYLMGLIFVVVAIWLIPERRNMKEKYKV